MIEDAAPRAPQTGVRRHALVPCAHIEKLPPELLAAILELLGPSDLRRAAAVSRLWYASAWCAGHSLSTSLVCNRFVPGSNSGPLNEVVQHALRTSRPLSLALKFVAFDNTGWSAYEAIVSSLIASLPVLVYLSVYVSRYARPNLASVLLEPAPNLREFVFLLEQNMETCHGEVPDNLFGGVAPKLRSVVLDRLPLGLARVPAFAHVTTLHMICVYDVTDIDYAEWFPCLRDLHLAFHTLPPESPTPESFRFGGLRLHRLVIEDLDFCTIIPAVVRSLDVSAIPVFEHVGTKLHSDDPIWAQHDLGALSIRLTHSKARWYSFSVLVVPAHRHWRRAYHRNPELLDEPDPIFAIPDLVPLGECVTYLRADGDHLIALLDANWPDLAALRALHVDCRRVGNRPPDIWPPPRRRTPWGKIVSGPERRRYVRCPALETLTIALPGCDDVVAIPSRDVALLGGALAQCERDAQERAALVLVGIELEQPVDDALLLTAFSSVRSCAHNSSWDRDGGLWDEDL